MVGLTDSGFEPLTYEQVKARLESNINAYNPGFDFSPESPDGQNISIFAFEIAQAFAQLNLVYSSFDPRVSTGQGLRNVGLIGGVLYASAGRSYAIVQLTGTAGVVVPAGSTVSSADSDWVTEFDAVIPASVGAIAMTPGQVPVTAGIITTIVDTIAGWTGVANAAEGNIGSEPQNDTTFRNVRNNRVMQGTNSPVDSIVAALFEVGIEQANVQNNDTLGPFADGTPSQHIHVTVAEAGATDAEIAQAIYGSKALGTPTYGSTTVVVTDSQGTTHDIKFTKAVAVVIIVEIDVTYLDSDSAGADDAIKEAVAAHINGLLAGEDVVITRLYEYITPYGKAQVDLLQIGNPTLGTINIPLSATEFATTTVGNITVNS